METNRYFTTHYQSTHQVSTNSTIQAPAVPPPAGDAIRPPRHERVPNGGRFSALRVLQRWLQKLLLHVHLRHGGQQVAPKHNPTHSRMYETGFKYSINCERCCQHLSLTVQLSVHQTLKYIHPSYSPILRSSDPLSACLQCCVALRTRGRSK